MSSIGVHVFEKSLAVRCGVAIGSLTPNSVLCSFVRLLLTWKGESAKVNAHMTNIINSTDYNILKNESLLSITVKM